MKRKPHPVLHTLTAALLIAYGNMAIAQQVPDAQRFNYSRVMEYTFDAQGRVLTETSEPTSTGHAQLCLRTTFAYDPVSGQQNSVTRSSCPGATGNAVIGSAASTRALDGYTYSVQTATGAVDVNVPAGLFATSKVNALGHEISLVSDPRFGTEVSKTDVANGLATTTTVDEFGRVTRTTRPDGTYETTAYCLVALPDVNISSNSSDCSAIVPLTGEVPADAVSFLQKTAYASNGAKAGPFTRVYVDAEGRTIRTASEGFDGGAQPAARVADLVITDTAYDAYGNAIYTAGPYFLTEGTDTTPRTKTEYDALNRKTRIWQSSENGDISQMSFPDGTSSRVSLTTLKYSGALTSRTNDKGQTEVTQISAGGQTLRVTDASGAQLAYLYDAFDNVVQSKDALGNVVTMRYDFAGNQVQQIDPDKGTWNYSYDPLKRQLTSQGPTQLALGMNTAMTYDALNRLTSRIEPEYTTNWYYDSYSDGTNCSKGVGQLCEVTTTNGVTRKYAFDSAGRLTVSKLSLSGSASPTPVSFTSAVTYGANGRVATQTYPSGLKVRTDYTGRGFARSLVLATPATVTALPDAQGVAAPGNFSLPAETKLWTARQMDAAGNVTSALTSNSVFSRAVYYADGKISELNAGPEGQQSVMRQVYQWDGIGNLKLRYDAIGAGGVSLEERFQYGDNSDDTKDINRLTRYSVTGALPGLQREVVLQYNALGSMLYRSDVGLYSYPSAGGTRPHAPLTVAGSAAATYDANGNLLTAPWGSYATLNYTTFDKVKAATGRGTNPATYSWAYDDSHARILETRTVSTGPTAGTRTTWYVNPDSVGGLMFERETNSNGVPNSNRHYLTVNGASIGMLGSAGTLPSVTGMAVPSVASIALNKVEYWHKDQLGSIAATTDHLGTVTASYSYDPFGKRREASGAYDESDSLVVAWSPSKNFGTARGFTGHEGVDDIGIVNMNGRIYDPELGVFLQADTKVTDAKNLQNFNRYGYVLNNPLNATDPSGFDNTGTEVRENECPLACISYTYDFSTTSLLGASPLAASFDQLGRSFTELGQGLWATAATQGNSFLQGWQGNVDSSTRPMWDSSSYKIGMFLRAAGVGAGLPEDFAKASKVEIALAGIGNLPIPGSKQLSNVLKKLFKHEVGHVPSNIPDVIPGMGVDESAKVFKAPRVVDGEFHGQFSIWAPNKTDKITFYHGTNNPDVLNGLGFTVVPWSERPGEIFTTLNFRQAEYFARNGRGAVIEFSLPFETVKNLQINGQILSRRDWGYPYGPESIFTKPAVRQFVNPNLRREGQ